MVERPGCGKVENWSGRGIATGFTTGWLREPPVRYAAGNAREVALRILDARFGEGKREGVRKADRDGECGREQPGQHEDRVFELADFQEAAVRRASRILDSRRGVVIADSVGLGKTYVALALVEEALRNRLRVAVFTPAALRREWTRALKRLRARLGVADAYGLPEPFDPAILQRPWPTGTTQTNGRRAPIDGWRARVDEGRAPTDGRPTQIVDHRPFLAWVSHERLSRGTYPHARIAGLDLVVVDEAHAFRSPRTRRYRALAELCRGARVVLLTATPVNNSVWDLYFQLRLFAGDGDFRDVGVPDLREAIRAAADAGTSTPPSLLPVLHEVVIRRTRPFLRQHYGGIRTPRTTSPVRFPRRAAPVPILYSLDGVPPGIDAIVETIETLTFAAFRPERYTGGDGSAAEGKGGDDNAGGGYRATGGVADLMRAGMLKRLESSLAAFRASLRRQLRYLDAFLSALDRGRLLRPRDHRALYTAAGDGDFAQLVLEEVALVPLPPRLDVARLRRDIAADRGRLADLLARAGPDDPKLDRLIRLLNHELRGEKVLLFTEYRDTARYLWRALVHRGGVALIDGVGAFLGTGRAGRRAVIERFAPRANHVRPPPARERVDLLIATDVLAEGLNLQDAAHVVSYDLPWNPVRLIQRIGRIDRLGSPHEAVHPYHFLPDRGLDRALRLLDRLRTKLTAIGRTVGADGAVLGGRAEGHHGALIDRLAAGDPDALDAIERADGAALEVMEALRVAWEKATERAGARRDWSERDRNWPGDGSHRETGGWRAWPKDGHTGRRDSQPELTRATAACIAVEPGRPRRVLVAYRIGTRAGWWVVEVDGRVRLSLVRDPDAAAAEILLAALGADAAGTDAFTYQASPEGSTPPPNRRDPTPAAPSHNLQTLALDHRLIARALAAVRPKVAERVAIQGAYPRLGATSPGADAARRILATLAAIPGGPEPALCARADAILAALTRPLDAGAETMLRRALAAIPPTGDAIRIAEDLIGALEAAIDRSDTVMVPVGAAPPGAAAARSPAPSSGTANPHRDADTMSGLDRLPRPTTPSPVPVELIGILETRPIADAPRG